MAWSSIPLKIVLPFKAREKLIPEKIFFLFTLFCIFASANRGVAQLASALAWGARGRTFESYHPDSNKLKPFRKLEGFCFFNMVYILV